MGTKLQINEYIISDPQLVQSYWLTISLQLQPLTMQRQKMPIDLHYNIDLGNSPTPVLSHAKRLGFLWSRSLSARPRVEENVANSMLGGNFCLRIYWLLSEYLQCTFC